MTTIIKTVISALFLIQTQAFAEENVISCSELGNLTHSFRRTDDGYRLLVNYPMYAIRPGYDAETGQVVGQGAIGIDVPIENDNIRMTGMSWVNEKVQFFKELFPAVELPNEAPITAGFIELNFSEEDCLVKKEGDFTFAGCRAQGPLTLNGMELEYIDFSMQNQIRRTLLNDVNDPSELVISEVEAVYANMSYAKKRGYGTYVYRSSTTYYPNGNDIVCLF